MTLSLSVRRALVVAGVVLTALLAWFDLGPWVVSPSERFYLVVPPLGVALCLVRSSDGWRKLKAQLVPALIYLGVLSILAAGYLGFLTLHTASAVTTILLGKFLRELLAVVYFLASFSLVVSALLSVLRTLVGGIADRLVRPQWAGLLLRQALPAVLALPIVLPYALAAFYVHRVKVPNPTVPAALADRPFEDVSFPTADGLTLRGWFIPARQPSSRTLLVCHGLGANRTCFLPFVDLGDALGANVLLFDFRGHGDSDGHTISFGQREKLDVLAAVHYLRTTRPGQVRELVAQGNSMGASALMQAAAEVEPPFDAVVIDSGFCSAVELTDSILGQFPPEVRPWLTGIGVPVASLEAGCWLPDIRNTERIGRVRAPLLIVHAQGDRLIACDHARRLFERAQAPKDIWTPSTGDHGSALAGAHDEYLERVLQLCRERKYTGSEPVASARVASGPR